MEIIILLLIAVVLIAVVSFRKIQNTPPRSSAASRIERDYSIHNDNNYDFDYEDEDTDKDSWEGGFWDASDPKRFTAHIEIDYVDGNNSRTTRSVRVREFDNELYGGIIMGHCEMRNATRTFRLDRIKKCIDLDTGEFIRDVKKYLNDGYEKSPERTSDILASDYIDVLKVIYYVAKADGQYRKEEKLVISEYIQKLMRDERITTKMIDEILREIDIPSLQGFKLALGRVLKGGEVDPMKLVVCCREIVKTQKKVHPMEQEALDYIDKKLATLPDAVLNNAPQPTQ